MKIRNVEIDVNQLPEPVLKELALTGLRAILKRRTDPAESYRQMCQGFLREPPRNDFPMTVRAIAATKDCSPRTALAFWNGCTKEERKTIRRDPVIKRKILEIRLAES